jgi:hypothetical protein
MDAPMPSPTQPLAAFPKVGHAFFARNGVKLAFGRRWDERIIHISDADRGGACGCQCPACGRKLVARKPDSDMAHHFAHAPLSASEQAVGIAPNCEHGHKTALHAFAQQILNDNKTLFLPPARVFHGGRSRQVWPGGYYKFDSAQLEKMDGETIPDVILYKGDQRMHVEIYVTHACGPQKRAKLVDADISAIEINLSQLPRDITLPGLPEQILTLASREWIHNRKVRIAWAELEAKRTLDAERSALKRAKDVGDLRREYAAAHRRALLGLWREDETVAALVADGQGELLEGPTGGEGYFYVHPKVWKALIVRSLLARINGVTPAEIVSAFRRNGWIVERFARLSDDPLLSEAGLENGGPEGAVKKYLGFLVAKNVADDWGWQLRASHIAEIERRALVRRLAERDAAERKNRRNELGMLATSIAAFDIAEFGTIVSVDFWMDHRPNGSDMTRGQIADEGGAAWHALKKGMTNTLAVLKDESEEPAADFDLPVSAALARMRTIHKARAEQRRLAVQEAAQRESDERCIAFISRAEMRLDAEGLGWIDDPHPRLDGLSPRAAAARSSAYLATATGLLDDLARQIAEKATWVEELERRAFPLLKCAFKVDAYMKGPDPKLAGLASPRTHTVNERTMMECLALLKGRVGKR